MARYLIETPVPDYTGTDFDDVHFHLGRAEVDELRPSVRAYCEQAGYTITDNQPPANVPANHTTEATE